MKDPRLQLAMPMVTTFVLCVLRGTLSLNSLDMEWHKVKLEEPSQICLKPGSWRITTDQSADPHPSQIQLLAMLKNNTYIGTIIYENEKMLSFLFMQSVNHPQKTKNREKFKKTNKKASTGEKSIFPTYRRQRIAIIRCPERIEMSGAMRRNGRIRRMFAVGRSAATVVSSSRRRWWRSFVTFG
uniref:Uncharacterized protein n=1 Tax=Romanomermis culicivorax TaxID=13658 RepID=A0A915IB33_ROMCU